MSKQAHKGASAIFSSAGTGVLSIASGIVLLPVVIATVGSADYGVWLLLSAVAIYLQFTDLGVGAAIVHFNSRARGGDARHALTQLLSAALLWNAAAAAVAIPTYLFFAHLYVSSSTVTEVISAETGNMLVVLGGLSLSTILLRPFDAALTSAGMLPVERRNAACGIVTRIVGTLVACFAFGTVTAVALAEVIAIVTPSVLSLSVVFHRKLARICWNRETFSVLRFMMSFSVRSFGTGAVGLLILQAGTVLVGVTSTPSDVTYFNAAFRVYMGVRQLVSWTTEPFRSTLSRMYVVDVQAARTFLLTLQLSSLLAASLACGALMFASSGLVALWLGPTAPTDDVIASVCVLLVGVVLNAIHGLFMAAGDAAGRPGAFFPIQSTWLVTYLILGYWWGSSMGFIGVCLALTVPLTVIEPLFVLRARKVLDISIRTWTAQVALPALAVVGPAAAIAATFVFVGMKAGWPATPILAALAFLVIAFSAIYCLRHRAPLARLPGLLGVEL